MGADDDDAVAGYLARAGEASMAGLALWWAFGVGAFVVSGFVMARLPAYANLEPEIALVRRLARAIKVCVVALVALAAKLVLPKGWYALLWRRWRRLCLPLLLPLRLALGAGTPSTPG